jgi:O-antigen biosynthesis protein
VEPESQRARESVERFDPVTMSGLIEAEHRARYHWAAQAVRGKEVLDAGCGLGYGSATLAAAGAARVVGLDISGDAIAEATARAGGRAEFVRGDIAAIPFPDGSFDVVTCFEALEHVAGAEAALDELSRVLSRDGLLLVSSPNRAVYTPGNPHHVSEFLPEELEATLDRRFANVRLYRQHPWVGSLVTDDDGLALADPDVELSASVRKASGQTGGEEVYTIAAASNALVPELDRVMLVTGTVDLRAWQERVWELEQEVGRLTPGPFERRLRSVARQGLRPLRRLRALRVR